MEVNSKGNYSWDGSDKQELPCTYNQPANATAECICDEMVRLMRLSSWLVSINFGFTLLP